MIARLVFTACLGLVVGCGSTSREKIARPDSRRPPLPDDAPPVDEPPAGTSPLLLELSGERDGHVVALVEGKSFGSPYVAGADKLRAAIGDARAVRPLVAGTTATETGALTGAVRSDCGDLYAPLVAPLAHVGYALSGASFDPQPRPTTVTTTATPADEEAAAAYINKRGVQVRVPVIEQVFEVDLDGDGKAERLLQATHPELQGDFESVTRSHYSMVIVVSGGKPVAGAGFLGTSGDSSFEVLALSAVADLTGDGSMEVIVTARHVEGFQTQIFSWKDDRLDELFRSTGGERDCADL